MFKARRDWKKYGVCYLIHALSGAVVAFLALTPGLSVLALVATLSWLSYQSLEWMKWKGQDTPAMDVADWLIGLTVGAGATIAWRAFF